MAFFGCNADKLAKYLAEKPLLYNNIKTFFQEAGERKLVSPDIAKSLNLDIDLLKKAQEISTSAQWFAFDVYDSWADDHQEKSSGVELYQKVNDELVRKLCVGSNGVPEEKEAISLLKSKKVKRVYTLTPSPKGYCGILHMSEDQDKDVIKRSQLDERQISLFKSSGIEAIVINNY